MGENDVSKSSNQCPHAVHRRDCDGDVYTYCTSCEDCKHRHDVKDCDGDIVSLCRL